MHEKATPIVCCECEGTEFTAYKHNVGDSEFTRLVCVECGNDFAAGFF